MLPIRENSYSVRLQAVFLGGANNEFTDDSPKCLTTQVLGSADSFQRNFATVTNS